LLVEELVDELVLAVQGLEVGVLGDEVCGPHVVADLDLEPVVLVGEEQLLDAVVPQNLSARRLDVVGPAAEGKCPRVVGGEGRVGFLAAGLGGLATDGGAGGLTVLGGRAHDRCVCGSPSRPLASCRLPHWRRDWPCQPSSGYSSGFFMIVSNADF